MAFYNTIVVRPDDIDRMHHVNNSVYLRWTEDVVHAHWKALANASEFAKYAWVAVRHEIDYRCPAVADDRLDVSTRIVEIRRARAWYETIISRDGTTLAEARSCWCCIDAETAKLTAMPRITARRFLPTVS